MNSEHAKAERALINAAIQLGNIAEQPWHYTAGLARQITAGGKPFYEMTIGELLQIDEDYGRRINEARERLISSRFNFATTISDIPR